jgi:hypothetical protein
MGHSILDRRTATRVQNDQVAAQRRSVRAHARVQFSSLAVELLPQSGKVSEQLPSVETDGAGGFVSEVLDPRFEGSYLVRKRLAFRRDRRYREP